MQVLFEMIVTIQVTHLMTLVMLKILVTMEMTAMKTTMLKNLVMRLMLVQTLTITDLLNL